MDSDSVFENTNIRARHPYNMPRISVSASSISAAAANCTSSLNGQLISIDRSTYKDTIMNIKNSTCAYPQIILTVSGSLNALDMHPMADRTQIVATPTLSPRAVLLVADTIEHIISAMAGQRFKNLKAEDSTLSVTSVVRLNAKNADKANATIRARATYKHVARAWFSKYLDLASDEGTEAKTPMKARMTAIAADATVYIFSFFLSVLILFSTLFILIIFSCVAL